MSKKPSMALAIIVCLLGSFFYIYEFMVRLMPQAMTHELMASFNVSAAGLGLIASMFFWGYMPMQIPAGALLDKFGPRKMLTAALLLCGGATLLFGFTHSPFIAGACRVLVGVMASFAFIAPLILAARWFHPKHYAMFAGLVQTLGCVGAIAGLTPVAYMSMSLGWRATTVDIALGGLIAAVLILLVVRDFPKGHPATLNDDTLHTQGHFRDVFFNKQIWAIALVGFCSWAPISIFATLWGVPFLMTLYHIHATLATYGPDMIWLGIGVGSPIAGWWSAKIASRRAPLVASACIGIVCSLLVIYSGADRYWLMMILLFGFGLAASSQVVTFGLILDNTPPKVMGTASGLNNMAVVMGGVICQPLVGFILKHVWNHTLKDGVPLYTLGNYHVALFMVPMIFVIGLLASLFLVKETKCELVHRYVQK